jgi:hypothetical protein
MVAAVAKTGSSLDLGNIYRVTQLDLTSMIYTEYKQLAGFGVCPSGVPL